VATVSCRRIINNSKDSARSGRKRKWNLLEADGCSHSAVKLPSPSLSHLSPFIFQWERWCCWLSTDALTSWNEVAAEELMSCYILRSLFIRQRTQNSSWNMNTFCLFLMLLIFLRK
jgi:hypothetical protein